MLRPIPSDVVPLISQTADNGPVRDHRLFQEVKHPEHIVSQWHNDCDCVSSFVILLHTFESSVCHFNEVPLCNKMHDMHPLSMSLPHSDHF